MTARWFLAAVPLAIGLAWCGAPPIAVSIAALAAIVPLVGGLVFALGVPRIAPVVWRAAT